MNVLCCLHFASGILQGEVSGEDPSHFMSQIGMNRSTLSERLGHVMRMYVQNFPGDKRALIPLQYEIACPTGIPSLSLYRKRFPLSSYLEPIFPDLRNLMYHEIDVLIAFTPYVVLPSLLGFVMPIGKKVLIDVGSNGWYRSARSLVDLYSSFLSFDLIFLIEPRQEGMWLDMSVPNVFWIEGFARIGARYFDQPDQEQGAVVSIDVIEFLKQFSVDDFVVLKFDVDDKHIGLTLEWPFLFDLIYSDVISLVDEIFIEMHFLYKRIGWLFNHHSMHQAYDILTQLRACGIAVHAWP